MDIPKNLFYTKEHEWALIEGNKARVGITDHAQSRLGDITYVELPAEGKEVKQFEMMASVESVKAASEVYAPLSGKLVSVNSALQASPETVNSSPYKDGWMAIIEIKDESEKAALMDCEKYRKYLESAAE